MRCLVAQRTVEQIYISFGRRSQTPSDVYETPLRLIKYAERGTDSGYGSKLIGNWSVYGRYSPITFQWLSRIDRQTQSTFYMSH